MKIRSPLFFLFLLLFSLTGCAPGLRYKSAAIHIKGSDTMRILMHNLAAKYMQTHPGISIYSEGGGSASGFQALMQGEADICAASRPIRPEEAGLLAGKYRNVGVAFRVAKDALSIYVNPENPVQDLTLKQLKQIFTGEITNWKIIGGNDQPILVLIRPPNSGTYYYFREHILEGGEYTASAATLATTSQIVRTVAKNSGAIGYGGTGYGPDAVHCKINGIPPSPDNVHFDLYPISRYLYLYTVRKPRGQIRQFIDWVIGPEGQKIVTETGYIPLWPAQ